jgi:hypothetical protein
MVEHGGESAPVRRYKPGRARATPQPLADADAPLAYATLRTAALGANANYRS